jgi:hypothetical protein
MVIRAHLIRATLVRASEEEEVTLSVEEEPSQADIIKWEAA